MKNDWWQADVSDLRKDFGLVEKPRIELPAAAKPILERRKKLEKRPASLSDVPKLMTMLEVQSKLRIGTTTVYKLIKQKKLTPIHNGRRVFFNEAQVLDYLLEIMGYEKTGTR